MARLATIEDFDEQVDTQPTIADQMKEWDAQNPVPTQRQVEAPTLSNHYGKQLNDILDSYRDPTEDAKEQKRQKARQTIAAISDGISAVANVVGTSHGGLQVYNPQTSFGAHMQNERAKKLAMDANERTKHRELLKAAAQQEMTDNQKKLVAYNTDKHNAAAEYASNVRNYNAQRANQEKAIKDQRDDERDAFKAKSAAAHYQNQDEIAAGNLSEKSRHNKAQEGIGRERNNISRNKGKSSNGYKQVFSSSRGTIRFKNAVGDDELMSMVGEMVEKGAITRATYNKVRNKLMDAAVAIQEGMRTAKGFKVVQDHKNARDEE